MAIPTQQSNEYVTLSVFPAERSGFGEAKPLGAVVLTYEDSSESESFEVPSGVARTLMRWKRESGQDGPMRRDACLSLVERATRQAAKDKILRLVSRRDYSKHELRRKLLQEGFDAEVANEAIEVLSDYGFVDDSRFADCFVRSKIMAGWGYERIVHELKRRGVDPQRLEGWPYEYIDPDDELSRAEEVAAKKCAYGPKPYPKLVRFLVGRGFSNYVAREAASRFA